MKFIIAFLGNLLSKVANIYIYISMYVPNTNSSLDLELQDCNEKENLSLEHLLWLSDTPQSAVKDTATKYIRGPRDEMLKVQIVSNARKVWLTTLLNLA